jgi:transposase-like protein
MDLSRAVYSRDLKIATMRALDAGSTNGGVARKYQLSPKLLERWRGEWRANGNRPFLASKNQRLLCLHIT